MYSCALVLIALILLKRHTLYQSEEVPFIEEIQEEQDDITQVQNTDIRITCDTICMYEGFPIRKDGTVSYEEVRMPSKYIGMNRVEMEEGALWDDSRVLSLEDKERGFESQHLELFSKERVKIVRIYDTTPGSKQFTISWQLIMKYGFIRGDRTTVYLKTDLQLEQLPATGSEGEIMQSKYIGQNLHYYHFWNHTAVKGRGKGNMPLKVVVIGGGVSGLAAAITAQHGARSRSYHIRA